MNSSSKGVGSTAQNNEFYKIVALVALVVQNASLILFMRYSRIVRPSSESYITSTAVMVSEGVKFLAASLLCFINDGSGNPREFFLLLYQEFWTKRNEFILLTIPAGLYTLQNNLQYVGASNLPADVFQVLSQLKIVSTAILSVLMLNRVLSLQQWLAVVLLSVGVAVVQLHSTRKVNAANADEQNALVGLCALLSVAFLSGFAGVYFEKVLKTTAASIWVRNIQLSFIGAICASAPIFTSDAEVIARDGFFRGYDKWTVIVILLSACGGLITAAVVKYADNVIKGFSSAIALVISSLASCYILDDSTLNLYFILGASIVIGSAMLYGAKTTIIGGAASKYEALAMREDPRK